MRGVRLSRVPTPGPVVVGRADVPPSSFFHVHAHSMYSVNDALPKVKDMVDKAKALGQPGLALTDHGNMGGAVQLYTECQKAGIVPYPGLEAYFVSTREDRKAKRRHLGLLAVTTPGYEALVRLCSRSHSRENFHFKPILDWVDLAEWKERGWTEGIVATTGCFFGLTVQTLIHHGPDAAKYAVARFAKLFPHTFVEIQNHNIDHGNGWNDASVAEALLVIADELGLPVVATQDAHYCEESDKPIHETLKKIAAFGEDLDDAVFPGDGFHLCGEDWVRNHHTADAWERSQEGYKALLDLNTLAIPELDNYKYNIPITVENPTETLRTLCYDALAARGLGGQYEERLAEELSVVTDTNMGGYLLMVKEVTDWCEEHHVFTQTRGSAAGSLICWLLDITQVDPIKYRLRFERFISRDRTKPPDIDLDVEDTRRDELVEWLKGRFNVTQISNWATYSVQDEEDGGRGSLIVAYKKIAKSKGVAKEIIEEIKSLGDLPAEDRKELLALSERKVFKSTGVHAAGLVVTTTKDEFDHLVPTMLIASSGTTVTQFRDKDVERLGLVKLDVLGLRTLSLLRRCTELLGRDVEDGLDWIPLDDTRTFTTVRNGATVGVFQLEGGTALRGCREIKVRSLKDIIVVMALYRPAVMKSGAKDTYIARREGREEVPERHQVIMRATKETFGLPVFQDQVIDILRGLGLDPDDLTRLLKAIKASNDNIAEAARTIAGFREQIHDLARGLEMTEEDFAFIWQAIEGFADYGFNRAHATVYGITAYRCAYLKTHHPLEFATALLATAEGTKKEAVYVSAVRQMGIRIMKPHVNISNASYSIDRQNYAVRRGLISIKGIGERTSAELAMHAPYDSIEDIIKRCDGRKVNGGKFYEKKKTINGHLLKLYEAGALSEIYQPQEA